MIPRLFYPALLASLLALPAAAGAQTLANYGVRRTSGESAARSVAGEAQATAEATSRRITSAAENERSESVRLNSAMVPRMADSVAEVAALSAARETSSAVIGEWQTALTRAKDDSAGFNEVLRDHLRNREQTIPATPLGEAVRIAEVAANERAYATVLKDIPRDQWSEMEPVRHELKKKFDAVAASLGAGTQLFVTADGNFRGAANTGGEGAPVGTGSLAVTALTRVANFKAGLAIASTQDTVRDGFGTSLLAPANGRALTSGLLDARLVKALPLHVYASASRALWQVHDTPDVRSASTTVLGLGALLYHTFAEARVEDTSLSLMGEIGLSARFLGGDLMAEDDSVRMQVLHTTGAAFAGLEAGMQINVGKMAGALQLYYMPHKSDERIPGFSGLQLVAGIGVTGDLFGTPD